jgi:hypothetical protein
MEDVLEVYAEPYEPRRPKGNFDATNKQLIQEPRLPLPAQAGQPQRFDDEYERNGTRHLFLFVEPQAGRRFVHVTEQRTKVALAHAMPSSLPRHGVLPGNESFMTRQNMAVG